jgi:hypothetical protein
VTYNSGVLRVLLLAVPFVAVAAVMILLNAVDAGPDTRFVALCIISVLNGVGIGLYVTRHGTSRSGQCQLPTASRRAARAGR